MATKKAKLYVALIAAITASLRKAYDELNKNEQYPDVEQDVDLIPNAHHIYKALNKALSDEKENERFEGLSGDEIDALRSQEQKANLKRLQEESAENFRALRATAEPVAPQELDEADDVDDDLDVDDDDNQEAIEETYNSLLERRNSLEKECKDLVPESVAFKNATEMLAELNSEIAEIESLLKD